MSEQSMIRINTKLDASGFSAGADKIKRKIEDLKKGIERIGNVSAVAEGMQKQTAEMEKNLSVQDKAIEKTKNKIAELKKKYAELSDAKAAKENSIVESVRNDKQNIFDASLEGNFAEKKALMQGKSKSEAQDIGDKAFDAYMQKIIDQQKEADSGFKRISASAKDVTNQIGEQNKELIKQTALRNTMQAQIDDQKADEHALLTRAASMQRFRNQFGGNKDKGDTPNGGVMSGLSKGIGNASGGLKNMLGLMGRFTLMTFGVMTAFRGIKQAISEAVSQSKELQAAIASIKMVAAVAVQPIAEGLVRGLAMAVSYIASIIKALTGVDILAKAAAAYADKQAKSAKKEADERKRSLASFDEIEVLQKNDNKSGGDGIGGFSDMLKQVDLGERLQGTLGKIKDIWDTIGSKIKEAWAANDNGVRILSTLSGMASDLWNWFDRILDTTLEWVQNLNLEPMFNSIAGAVEAMRPVFNDILNILEWIYTNVVLPIAKWLIEGVIPAGIDIIKGALQAVHSALEALAPLAQDLWDKILKPVADFLGDVFVAVLQLVAEKLTDLSNWISNNQELFSTLVGIVASLVLGFKGVSGAMKAVDIVSKLVTNGMAAVSGAIAFITGPIGIASIAIGALIAILVALILNWDKVKEFAINCVNGIKEAFGKIGDWFKEKVFTPLGNFFEKFRDTTMRILQAIATAFKNTLDGFASLVRWFADLIMNILRGAFDGVIRSFNDTVRSIKQIFNGIIDFVAGVFTGNWSRAWQGVVNIFNGIVGGIASLFKLPINGIIGLINGFISGVNRIRIPSWVPGFGGMGISIPHIPYLAKGAVIPPNKQFVAMLGDQTHGNNLEAPEDLIRQIVREEAGGFNQEAIALLRIIASKNFSITKREAGAAAVEYINDETERTGNSPVLSF